LKDVADASDALFFLTHNYSAYAMVQQARDMIAAGEIGAVRHVQVTYLSGFLAGTIDQKNKQAAWRTSPQLAGSGVLGDIGTHAWHLMRTVTGLVPESLAADLATLVPGRAVEDHAQVLLRFADGARGSLCASHVASGCGNELSIRVFGENGNLAWAQHMPERLTVAPIDGPVKTYTRGGPGEWPGSERLGRIGADQPEGYFEAFANVYSDAATAIRAHGSGGVAPIDRVYATIEDGIETLQFVDSCQRSAVRGPAWTSLTEG